jgi:hypothetical protein
VRQLRHAYQLACLSAVRCPTSNTLASSILPAAALTAFAIAIAHRDGTDLVLDAESVDLTLAKMTITGDTTAFEKSYFYDLLVKLAEQERSPNERPNRRSPKCSQKTRQDSSFTQRSKPRQA